MTARLTAKSFILVGLFALLATGCADEERVLSPVDPVMVDAGDPDGGAGGRGDDVEVGGCEDGAIRTCKIQIDENNCFVGAQQCEFGLWGDCLDPDDLEGDVVPASDLDEEDAEDEEG